MNEDNTIYHSIIKTTDFIIENYFETKVNSDDSSKKTEMTILENIEYFASLYNQFIKHS